MASRYQHRIGVRAEICFDLTLDARNPTPKELSELVSQALKQAANHDGGFKVNALPGGIVYPIGTAWMLTLSRTTFLIPKRSGSLTARKSAAYLETGTHPPRKRKSLPLRQKPARPRKSAHVLCL